MGVMKKKFIEEQIEQELELEMVDSKDGEVTFKVVEVDNEREDISYVHVREEAKVEEAIERMYNKSQEDLFNSEDYNWSGLRWVILYITQKDLHVICVVLDLQICKIDYQTVEVFGENTVIHVMTIFQQADEMVMKVITEQQYQDYNED